MIYELIFKAEIETDIDVWLLGAGEGGGRTWEAGMNIYIYTSMYGASL